MRKEYRKAVRERFTLDMAARFPEFRPLKVKALILFGGESVYRWERTETLHCFVLLVPDGKGRQAFTVELGWSKLGRFPEVNSRPSVLLAPDDLPPVDIEEGIVRLGGLVSNTDVWWSLPDPAAKSPGDLEALQASLRPVSAEVARERAGAPVEAALQLFEERGLAFFDALAG